MKDYLEIKKKEKKTGNNNKKLVTWFIRQGKDKSAKGERLPNWYQWEVYDSNSDVTGKCSMVGVTRNQTGCCRSLWPPVEIFNCDSA